MSEQQTKRGSFDCIEIPEQDIRELLGHAEAYVAANAGVEVGDMAMVDSSSKTAAITAAYLDNISYFEDNSVTMAKAFIGACQEMLTPTRRAMLSVRLPWPTPETEASND